jgi:hypothetical protein
MEKSHDRDGIADFVQERFQERYIRPFCDNNYKNGFIMMASACLMIEALESVWRGWVKSPNSALAFCQFFDRDGRFVLRGHAGGFYTHVRCGIMHQGETTGGWHIRRDQSRLFDSTTMTVDATLFLGAMDDSLVEYCSGLKVVRWDTLQWKNLLKKMKNVCENTKV